MVRIFELKTNGRISALGIDSRTPEFSWLLASSGRAGKQSAYRILVADTREALRQNNGNIWDTGKVHSGKTHGILYEGAPLHSRRIYFWKVKVWDQDGCEGDFSEAESFETAFLDPDEWEAGWIGGNALLRKEFEVSGDLSHARVYVTGLAYYELYLNGRKVGDQVLTPSYTYYEQRIEYQVYGIEEYLSPGMNAAGIMLGGQWPNGHQIVNVTDEAYYNGERKARLQIELEYRDGTRQRVITDESWVCAPGPVVDSSVFDGETYDARREQKGWDQAGYDDEAWQQVHLYQHNGAVLFAQALPPIKVVQDISPKKVTHSMPNTYIADIGQNIAGWMKISVSGEKGKRVSIRHSEVLHDDGSLNEGTLRGAKSTDTYILKGEGVEVYAPRFTYHGFRYVQIECESGVTLHEEKLAAQVVCNSVQETGQFECSNQLFNRIHQAMWRTFRSNMHSIPTDNCVRDERQGWMADGLGWAEAAIYSFDMQHFYRKWLQDIQNTQNPETGNIEYVGAPKFVKTECFEWTFAYFGMVYELYRHYDDRAAAGEHYPHLKHYCEYLATREENHLLKMQGLGDWLGMKHTQTPFITGPLYYRAIWIMADLARALGYEQDADVFYEKAQRIRDSYHEAYYNPHRRVSHLRSDSGYYGSCYDIGQLPNALPLLFDMPPQKDRDIICDKLIRQVTEVHGKAQLTTGVIGTRYLIDALAGIGRNDVAYQLFNKTDYPSWGFMLEKGATTIWERWEHMTDHEMNSHNQPILGAPDCWFFKELAGIKPLHFDPEHRRVFQVSPYFHPELDYVKSRVNTPWGEIKVEWERNGEQVDVKLQVPANCLCEFMVGSLGTKAASVKESQCEIIHQGQQTGIGCDGITDVRIKPDGIRMRIDSGEYTFSIN